MIGNTSQGCQKLREAFDKAGKRPTPGAYFANRFCHFISYSFDILRNVGGDARAEGV